MITSLQRQKKIAESRHKNLGISITANGIGDSLQFSSLPENFYNVTGSKLIDVSKCWFFDHNPYVERDQTPVKVTEMWNFPKKYEWPNVRHSVYMSNAEIHLAVFGLRNPKLIRPRLYQFEEYPAHLRYKILFQTQGRSHGKLPDPIIEHVLKKYKYANLYHIGLPTDPDLGIPKIVTSTLWDLAREISQAKMVICPDSGPSWIGACYPDVWVKKIRTRFQGGYCDPKDWVPLDVKNHHSFWDDRSTQIYNTFEEDVGFTLSYKKI
jgi:hypothetical protein